MRVMKWLPLYLTLFLLSTTLGADDEHLSVLKAQALKGDAVAQFVLGKKYHLGLGVKKNYNKSTQWFRKAAIQGHPRAQYYLGEINEKGLGGSVNNKKAIKWYRKSANQDDAQAQYCLGRFYERGVDESKVYASTYQGASFRAPGAFVDAEFFEGEESRKNLESEYVKSPFSDPYDDQETKAGQYRRGFILEQNYNEAVIWYQKAANQGHTQAQINLGVLCAKGMGTEQDSITAYMWFTIAHSVSESFVTTQLIEKLRETMTQEQINEADIMANYWLAHYKE